MESDSHLSLAELRALEAQIIQEPAGSDGTLAFLKTGMLEVIRTAIAALEAPAAAELMPITAGRLYCAHCGDSFKQTTRGRPKLYCSPDCREAAAADRKTAGQQ